MKKILINGIKIFTGILLMAIMVIGTSTISSNSVNSPSGTFTELNSTNVTQNGNAVLDTTSTLDATKLYNNLSLSEINVTVLHINNVKVEPLNYLNSTSSINANNLYGNGSIENLNLTNNMYVENNITTGKNVFYNVTKEIPMDISRFKLAGINPPQESFVSIFPILKFDKSTNESVYGSMHVVNDYRDDSDFNVKFYWSPTTTGTNVVKWCVELINLEANNGGLLSGATQIYCINDAGEGTTNKLQATELLTINGTGAKEDNQFGFRVYRGADHADDTYNADASLVTVQIYYNSYRMGET